MSSVSQTPCLRPIILYTVLLETGTDAGSISLRRRYSRNLSSGVASTTYPLTIALISRSGDPPFSVFEHPPFYLFYRVRQITRSGVTHYVINNSAIIYAVISHLLNRIRY